MGCHCFPQSLEVFFSVIALTNRRIPEPALDVPFEERLPPAYSVLSARRYPEVPPDSITYPLPQWFSQPSHSETDAITRFATRARGLVAYSATGPTRSSGLRAVA